ncbi:hypothetical protein [Paenibacillus xylanexedens]|nr:hypothetical protein [Paenibacillus xylanexedens]
MNSENQGEISFLYCSPRCVMHQIKGIPDDISFAGASKKHNLGVRFKNKFYLERLAQNWDANIHDFGVTVVREKVVETGIVLNKLKQISHPNLLKIIDMCLCTVVIEYVDGIHLSTKKGEWILGPFSNTIDYVDLCNEEDLFSVIRKLGQVLLVLHENGICHTDPTDHNVMISNLSGEPILIDLIGAMPYTKELELLDNVVFLNHLVIPLAARKGIQLPDSIVRPKLNNSIIERLVTYLGETIGR